MKGPSCSLVTRLADQKDRFVDYEIIVDPANNVTINIILPTPAQMVPYKVIPIKK